MGAVLYFAGRLSAVMVMLGMTWFPASAQRKVTELPEVLVESKQRNMLHVLAYVRENSMLTTYSDTVTLFREKLVDFMLPAGKKPKFKGWRIPRVIKSESYYRFTDADGLDSVSDTSRHHFSWSDWMGLPPDRMELPAALARETAPSDTLFGKYSPVEIWDRNSDVVTVQVNVLADTVGRRWVPNLKFFFADDKVEFEDLKLNLHYSNVLGESLRQRDLDRLTYRLDANGRGHSMFRFNRREEAYYATTEGEVYVLDMEYVSEKEAKKWADRKYDDEVEIIRAQDAPPIDDATLALVDRVEHIDKKLAKLNYVPDRSMMRMERHRSKGGEALRYLKNITGISDARAGKARNDQWRKFRDSLKK